MPGPLDDQREELEGNLRAFLGEDPKTTAQQLADDDAKDSDGDAEDPTDGDTPDDPAAKAAPKTSGPGVVSIMDLGGEDHTVWPHNPFSAPDSGAVGSVEFPFDRWERAGASIDEQLALSERFDSDSPQARRRLVQHIASISDTDLTDHLERLRVEGFFEQG